MTVDIKPHVAGMLDLPIELHLSITHHLAFQPRNLFSLLKTCRALHTVYSQKCIWDTALQIICLRDALFVPSYPIQSMTVPHLQRAVMGPDLWNSRLRAGEPFIGADVQSVETFHRQEDIAYQNPAVPIDEQCRVYLVPGGRYLFDQAHNVISLWDLGMPNAFGDRDKYKDALGETSLRLLDSLEVSEVRKPGFFQDQPPEFAVHQSSDGCGLVLLVAATALNQDTDRVELSVYKITPSADAPRFQQLASLTVVSSKFGTLPLGLGNISMTSNFVILYPLQHIMVWDFTSNRYTLWSTTSNRVDRDSTEIQFLSHNSMVLASDTGVQTWSIPSPSSMEPVPDSKTIRINPATGTDMPEPTPTLHVTYGQGREYEPLVWTLSPWYNPLDLPILFEAITGEQSVFGGLRNYRVLRIRLDAHPHTHTASVHSSSPSSSSGPNSDHPHPCSSDGHSLDTRPSSIPHPHPQLELQRELSFPFPHNVDAHQYHSLHRISGDLLFSFYKGCADGYDFGIVYSRFYSSPWYRSSASSGSSSFEDVNSATTSKSRASTGSLESSEVPSSYDHGVVGMTLDSIGARSPSLTFCSASGRVVCAVFTEDVVLNGGVSQRAHRHSVRVYDFSNVFLSV